MIATHRVQDAFGMANFRFDEKRGHVVAAGRNGSGPELPQTNVLVLRQGEIYFEGAAEGLLHSSDEYLKRFLVPAE